MWTWNGEDTHETPRLVELARDPPRRGETQDQEEVVRNDCSEGLASGTLPVNAFTMQNELTGDGEMEMAHVKFDWVEQLALLQIQQAKFPPADLFMLYKFYKPGERHSSSGQSAAARIRREPAVWNECFGNFLDITVHFHGRSDPGLHDALRSFKEKINCTSKVYRWDAAYRLATTYHTKVNRCGRVTDAIAWNLSKNEIETFCKAEDALDQGDSLQHTPFASSLVDISQSLRPMELSKTRDTIDSAFRLHQSFVGTGQNSIRSSPNNLPLSSPNLPTASYSTSTAQGSVSPLPPSDKGQFWQSNPTPSRIVNPFIPKSRHDPGFSISRRKYVADTRPSCPEFNSIRGCKYQQCRYAHRCAQFGEGGHGATKHAQVDRG